MNHSGIESAKSILTVFPGINKVGEINTSGESAEGTQAVPGLRRFEMMQLDGKHPPISHSLDLVADVADVSKRGKRRIKKLLYSHSPEALLDSNHIKAKESRINNTGSSSNQRKNFHRRVSSFPPTAVSTPPTVKQMQDFERKKLEEQHSGRTLDKAPKMPRADQQLQNSVNMSKHTKVKHQAEPPILNLTLSSNGNTPDNRGSHNVVVPVDASEWPEDPSVLKQAETERRLYCIELAPDSRRIHGRLTADPIEKFSSHKVEVHPKNTETMRVMPVRTNGTAPILTAYRPSAPQHEIPSARAMNIAEEFNLGNGLGGPLGLSNHSNVNTRAHENTVSLEQEHRRQAANDHKIDRFFIKRAKCDFTLMTTIKNVLRFGVPTAAHIKHMMEAINYLEAGLKKNHKYGPDDPWFERITWIKSTVTGPHGRQVRALRSIYRLLNGEGIMFREDENSEVYKEAESNNILILRERDASRWSTLLSIPEGDNSNFPKDMIE